MPSLTKSPAWLALQQHWSVLKQTPLASIITDDPQRLQNCALTVEGLHLNFALQYVTPTTISLLTQLAEQQGLADWRARMYRGDKINTTENRAVLHVALRQQDDQPIIVDGENIIQDVRYAHKRMADFVNDVRNGRWLGATGQPIRHVVNLGIGGSDLGPRAVVQALDSYTSGPLVHFVANVDAFDLGCALAKLNPAETLFIVASKTFTTQETLLNAAMARQWLVDKLGDHAVSDHFIAVSTNTAKVREFGILEKNMFPIWDWVGGRFSLWSSVGIGIALAIGMEHFERLLEGAAAMDEHFLTTPLQQNIPALMALFGVWNRNFLGAQALAVLPYSERLREFPRYLQQLDMESNGKSVTRDGLTADYSTAPIILGECGTVGQHSFHQWLHQGSEIIAADFIGVIEDDLDLPVHHQALRSNLVAQAGALAFGQTQIANAWEFYAGGRPSNIVTLDRLDPYHLGLLIALYEHKIFTQGVIWNINSFDQPGVELGKKIAKGLGAPTFAVGLRDGFLNDLFEFLA